MEAGVTAHVKVDDPTSAGARERRSVDLVHVGRGLVGRCDVVRVHGSDQVSLVEHKATPIKRTCEVTPSMRVQLALQRECLVEMGFGVTDVSVWFSTHRWTVTVDLDEDDVSAAWDAVENTRRVCASDVAPAPLVDDPRCSRCSHVGVCLPDENRGLSSDRPRIVASNPEGQILHVATPGSRASIRQGRVEVWKRDEKLLSVPLERVCGVVVYSNVDVSSALLRELMWRRATVVWCSGTGRVYGWTQTAWSANGLPRSLQRAWSQEGRVDVAREMIASKIANQATLLRRNGSAATSDVVKRLRVLQRRAEGVLSTSALFGVEGEAAALYFSELPTMVKSASSEFVERWPGRQGRGACDPLNSALNFAYSLLLTDTVRALVACGLDPHAGFLHSSGRNKPALALDLMEEFRAVVADSAVMGAINNGELKVNDFSTTLGAARLRDTGRKTLIAAYERRAQTQIRHPVFGYSVTWRRAMEVQARMVLGVVDGTQESYRGVRVR